MNVVYFTHWLYCGLRSELWEVEGHLPLIFGGPVRSFWEFGGPSADIFGSSAICCGLVLRGVSSDTLAICMFTGSVGSAGDSADCGH